MFTKIKCVSKYSEECLTFDNIWQYIQQKEKQNESKNAVFFVGMIKLRNSSSLYEIKLNTCYTLHITSLIVINTNFRVILKAMWKRHMWNRPLVPNISADHRFHCIINVHTTAYLANAVSERQLLGVHARECGHRPNYDRWHGNFGADNLFKSLASSTCSHSRHQACSTKKRVRWVICESRHLQSNVHACNNNSDQNHEITS